MQVINRPRRVVGGNPARQELPCLCVVETAHRGIEHTAIQDVPEAESKKFPDAGSWIGMSAVVADDERNGHALRGEQLERAESNAGGAAADDADVVADDHP